MERLLGDGRMTLLDLGLHRRVRVWLDEVDLPMFEEAGRERRQFETHAPEASPPGTVTLEAILPRGGMTNYGALGATFTPNADSSLLVVEVGHSGEFGLGPRFDSTIAVPPEKPVLGLPENLVSAVFAGVNEQLILGPDPGPGMLLFNRAAHGVIGSSPIMFTLLARAVVRLLSERPTDPSGLSSSLLEALG